MDGQGLAHETGTRLFAVSLRYNRHSVSWFIEFLLRCYWCDKPLGFSDAVSCRFQVPTISLQQLRHRCGAKLSPYIIILFRRRFAISEVLGEYSFSGVDEASTTRSCFRSGLKAGREKLLASLMELTLNFAGCPWLVFPEPRSPESTAQGIPASGAPKGQTSVRRR